MRKRINIVAVGVVVGGLLTGCGSGDGGDSESEQRVAREKPHIYTVNYPLQYFAERIGGDGIEVRFPAPRDVDPAYWMPDRKTVKAYQSADLILLNGAGYATWLGKVSLPDSRLVDTSAAFKAQLLKVEDVVTHSHGRGGEHSHVGTASHTWLNPRLAVMQAEAVRDALVNLAPGKAESFKANFELLKVDLMDLDATLNAILKPQRDRHVLFSHPVYQYFQQRFALNSRSLHWEPDETPTEKQLTTLAKLRSEHPATLLIWEGAPLETTVAALKASGLASVTFDICSNAPSGDGDFLSVMRENAGKLGSALKK